MAGYSSRAYTYSSGDTILAVHTNDEFDGIIAAFNASTGHNHDGTAGEGARVVVTDTTGGTQYGVPVLNGSGQQVTSTAAVTAGQILVGQSAAVPAPVTLSGDATLAASGAITLIVSAVKSVPTDSGTATATANAVTIAGGEGIDTSASGTTVTITAEDASATNKGVAELATNAETVTGTDTVRVTTPANITAKMAAPGAIGGTTPAAATFTDLTASGTIILSGTTLSAVGELVFGAASEAAARNAISIDGMAGGVLRVYTATDTWTKPANLGFIEVIVTAAGGGGGGVSSDAINRGGGGGAAGGTAIKRIAAASLGATETATIGAAGAGGVAADGATGGTSSFGAHCSATGGTGGIAGKTATPSGTGGTTSGAGSGGDVNLNGGGGWYGNNEGANASDQKGIGGNGGASYWGGGGRGASGVGDAGQAYGSGGGGFGRPAVSASGGTGGAGAAGVVIVREFYK